MKEFVYNSAETAWNQDFLVRAIERKIRQIVPPPAAVLDVGCGNGSISGKLAALGYVVTGIDSSTSGIAAAAAAHPDIKFQVGSAYDDMIAQDCPVDAVVCIEVVEHIYDPRAVARKCLEALKPGGALILSTPYHGYAKNIALALSGRFDRHFDPLWDGGHIKFFSATTLRRLLSSAGFVDLSIHRLGRIPPFARSLLAVARKPAGPTEQVSERKKTSH